MSNVSSVPRVVVGVIIYNDKQEVFFAKSHKWENKWCVVGGHVDVGETLHDCVRREVKEETNLDVVDIDFLSVDESIFNPMYSRKRHMIFLNYCAKASSDEVVLNSEFEEGKWFSVEDALKLDMPESTKRLLRIFSDR